MNIFLREHLPSRRYDLITDCYHNPTSLTLLPRRQWVHPPDFLFWRALTNISISNQLSIVRAETTVLVLKKMHCPLLKSCHRTWSLGSEISTLWKGNSVGETGASHEADDRRQVYCYLVQYLYYYHHPLKEALCFCLTAAHISTIHPHIKPSFLITITCLHWSERS
jgi:hypothetical protein